MVYIQGDGDISLFVCFFSIVCVFSYQVNVCMDTSVEKTNVAEV